MHGTLTALGTTSERIIFAAIKDDAFGGDTNLDGPSEGAMDDWGGVTLDGVGALNQLHHVELHHFGDGPTSVSSARGIDIHAPTVLTHSLFQDGRNAVRAFASPTVENNVVDGCGDPAFTVARLMPFQDSSATRPRTAGRAASSYRATHLSLSTPRSRRRAR